MLEPNEDLRRFVYSEELVALVSAANDISAFMERLRGLSGRAFIENAVRMLPAVYAAMLGVGPTEPVYEAAGEPSVTEKDWADVYQRIAVLLGPYNEILRPAETEEFDRSDLVTHTISEDLADVYQELRDFTSVYSTGMEKMMNDAAWELKERFNEHWGKKLLRSLLALHELYAAGTDPEEKL